MKILPTKLGEIIKNCINEKQLNEIRLRVGKPIVVFLGGQAYFLSEDGLTHLLNKAMTASSEMISDIIFRASDCSIYAVNEQIKRGFITIHGGIRIGICGEVVSEKNVIQTIKSFSSLNIRIPHAVKNCSLSAFDYILPNKSLKNTLVISPPGAGKTTFIRDFVFQLSSRNFCSNVLILDERGEIASLTNGEEGLPIGNFADVLSFVTKKEGFEFGIRSMSPNLIVTDEIGNEEDINSIEYAVNCGVNIMATAHADSIEQLKRKTGFLNMIQNRFFSRYIVLSSSNGPGTIEGIFDENFERMLRVR